MNFGYGIDLAQSLNYCGIVVTSIEEQIRLVTIKKIKNSTYPELSNLLIDDLFKRFPPSYVCVDYTNEKSFSETLEAHLNNGFLDQSSSSYKKWQCVEPVVFTQASKLQLKQNARELFEKKYFVWPKKEQSDPAIWPLVEELWEQMMREAGTAGPDGQLRFPKPAGYDNDLIIALELNLYGGKKFLPDFTDEWFYISGYQTSHQGCFLCRPLQV